MCGVVAIVGRQGQGVPPGAAAAAADALVHRGPDDAGAYTDKNVAFGFRRLAIIDLSAAGHQPMTSADGRLTIVFNGEIFNYLEIRSELAALGHRFESSSDTEVLLMAYRQWGPDCVHRLNGMWAFLIHDRHERTIFGARDRFGVKPLYFWQNPAWFVFASEPRAIAASGMTTLSPAWPRLAEAVMWNLMDHGDATCFADIHQMPAGHRFWIDAAGRLTHEAYWQLPPPEEPGAGDSPPEFWIEKLGALTIDAVRLRLRSDVPVGFTLSGGLDSTLLICEAARSAPDHDGLMAFSYQDAQYDEQQQIRDTLAQTGARQVTLRDQDLDVAALLPEIVRAHGEPLHSLTAVANYALFGLARQHGVKVVIGGQGADEVLGGYPTFQWDFWHSLAADGRWTALLQDVRTFAKVQARSSAATLASTLLRSLRIALGGTRPYQHLRSLANLAPPRTATTRLFSPDLLALAGRPTWRPQDFRAAATQRSGISHWPLPMHLRIEDRSSMAHSVEARLPFMDYRLVEHALRMPDELKHAGGLNKVALRRAAAGRIPSSVLAPVRKFGFPVSTSGGTNRRLHALCVQLAASRELRERGVFDLPAIDRLLGSDPPESPDQVEAMFHLAQTEIWLRDHGPSTPPASGGRR